MSRKLTELRPLMVRIPESLRRKLEKEAKRQDRSMNAEIIDRLDQSFVIPPLATATANATAVLEKMTVVASNPIAQKPTDTGNAEHDDSRRAPLPSPTLR